MKYSYFFFAALVFFALLTGCNGSINQTREAGAADLILSNGRIYTLDPGNPWVEAVAIKDGKFSYVGDREAVQAYRGKATQFVDLQGKMAMPGINDAHVHPVWGGIKELFECKFPFSATPDDIAAAVADCAAESPNAEWIIGGQWDSNLFVNYDIPSPRAFLDRVSAGKAVILTADSGHDAWVNSKVLELAGINADTPDVEGGVLVRDPKTGEPNGLLLEHAKDLVQGIVPDWTPEQYRAAASHAMTIANQFGITGFKEAWASKQGLAAYKALGDRGEATLHVAASIDVKYALDKGPFDPQPIRDIRDRYRAAHVDTRFVKIFMDGVPTSSRTAAMLDNYLPAGEGGHRHNGSLHYNGDELGGMISALDREGFTVKIHTAGDRSVRVTLDAIEQARRDNGDSGLRHELAHAGYIDDTDLPRFAKLNAVADVSPYLWHPSPIIDSVLSAVGERGEHYWPIKTLLVSGAHVAAGSDWPAAVPSINPWVGIEAMVSRADPRATSAGTLWPEQAVTLEQALEIYTLNGARALRLDDQTGSVTAGKSADLILLNHNLFEVPVADISDTQVEMTLFAGQIVHRVK